MGVKLETKVNVDKLAEVSEELKPIAEKIVKGLNPEQCYAVLSTEGMYRLVAGAGAGKTNVITRRLAWLVGKGVKAEKILSLTFTNKAAEEMRTRAANLLGVEKHSLSVSTFHSYCNMFLARHIECLGWNNFNICTDIKFEETLQDVLENTGMLETFNRFVAEQQEKAKIKFFAFSKAKFLTLLKGRLAKYRQEEKELYIDNLLNGVKVGELAKFTDIVDWDTEQGLLAAGRKPFKPYRGKPDPLKSWVQLLINTLGAYKLLSFDDLILLTGYILNNNEQIANEERLRYDYVQIDEFQDTDNEQLDIVVQLVKGSNNLFVVGDSDQSIYSFRGARPEIFTHLEKTFPEIETIFMCRNYRSVPEILNAGNQVIKLCEDRIEKELLPTRESNNNGVHLILDTNVDRYVKQMVDNIVDSVKNKGYKYKDIAVLFRTGKSTTIEPLQKELKRRGVPFGSSNKAVNDSIFNFVIAVYRAICMPYDVNAYRDLIHVVRGNLEANTMRSITLRLRNRVSEADNVSCIDVLKAICKDYTAIMCVVDFIERMVVEQTENNDKTYLNSSIFSAFTDWYCNTYLSFDMQDDACKVLKEQVDAIIYKAIGLVYKFNEDYTAMVWETKLNTLLNELMTYKEELLVQEDKDTVKFLTIHKSKGLEFKDVYCIDMVEGVLPFRRAEDLDEECRIAYVAYTRAKDNLYIMSGEFEGRGSDKKSISRYVKCLDVCEIA